MKPRLILSLALPFFFAGANKGASRAFAAEGIIMADVPNADNRKKLRREMLLLIIWCFKVYIPAIKVVKGQDKNKNGTTFSK
jgi:hypothetical protein